MQVDEFPRVDLNDIIKAMAVLQVTFLASLN
jgi:hypothetical protein